MVRRSAVALTLVVLALSGCVPGRTNGAQDSLAAVDGLADGSDAQSTSPSDSSLADLRTLGQECDDTAPCGSGLTCREKVCQLAGDEHGDTAITADAADGDQPESSTTDAPSPLDLVDQHATDLDQSGDLDATVVDTTDSAVTADLSVSSDLASSDQIDVSDDAGSADTAPGADADATPPVATLNGAKILGDSRSLAIGALYTVVVDLDVTGDVSPKAVVVELCGAFDAVANGFSTLTQFASEGSCVAITDGEIIAGGHLRFRTSVSMSWPAGAKQFVVRAKLVSAESWHWGGAQTVLPETGYNPSLTLRIAHGGNAWERVAQENVSLSAVVVNRSGVIFTARQGKLTQLARSSQGVVRVVRDFGLPASPMVNDLIVDGNNVLYAATTNGVFRLSPERDNFPALEYRGLGNEWINRFALTPSGALLAASQNGAIYRWDTTLDPPAWRFVQSNLAVRGFVTVADAIWVATTKGLYRSTDDGESFILVAQDQVTLDAVGAERDGKTLYLGDYDYLWRGTEVSSWVFAGDAFSGQVEHFLTNAFNSVFATSTTGFYAHLDDGLNQWFTVNDGLTHTLVADVAVDPTSGHYYLATRHVPIDPNKGGLHRSVDPFETVTPSVVLEPGSAPLAVVLEGTAGQTLLAPFGTLKRLTVLLHDTDLTPENYEVQVCSVFESSLSVVETLTDIARFGPCRPAVYLSTDVGQQRMTFQVEERVDWKSETRAYVVRARRVKTELSGWSWGGVLLSLPNVGFDAARLLRVQSVEPTWTKSPAGGSIYGLTIDSSGKIYAGKLNAIVQLTRNGSQAQVANQFSVSGTVYSLVADGTTIYAATTTRTYRYNPSLEAGFVPFTAGTGDVWGNVVAITPGGQPLLAIQNTKVYRWDPDHQPSAQWVAATPSFYATGFAHLGADLYASSNSGLYHSTDDGKSWTKIALDGVTLDMVTFDSEGTMWLGDNGGYRIGTGSGASWSFKYTALPNPGGTVRSIAFTHLGWILMATTSTLFESWDGGYSWLENASGMSAVYLWNMVLDPSDGFVVLGNYAPGDAGVFVSIGPFD